VLLWFVATSVAAVWLVFREPRFDYRPLVVGALLADPVDALSGGAGVMHSLLAPVVAMVLVMGATVGRRPLRKHLLALPIGMFLHLVADGAFRDTELFWWPATGSLGEHPLPVVARGWWNVPLELAAAAILLFGARALGVRSVPEVRRVLSTGRLPTAGATPPPDVS